MTGDPRRLRGSILLEILLAIVLFAGAAAVTVGILNSSLAATRQAALRLRAADLARTAIAEIEAGVPEERASSTDSDGLLVDVRTSRSSFPGLTLCEVSVRGRGEDGVERVVFQLRQLVRTPEEASRIRRSPRRGSRAAGRPARDGFTLFEVLVSLGLIALLVGAMGVFLSDALRVRAMVADRVARGLAAEAVVAELERALETCVVEDATLGTGVRGDALSIDVVRCGLATSRLGTAEPRRAFEPLERCRIAFAPGEPGRVSIARGEVTPTPLTGPLHDVRFRYFDGEAWREDFDSRSSGRLPVAVEVSIWFEAPRGEGAVEERREFDEDPIEEPSIPPDRRRVIAIPDPRGEQVP